MITIDHNAIHYNGNYWKEPDTFEPQRFNKESPWSKTPSGEKIHPLAWNPFSAGPRNCLGQNLAMNETKALTLFILLGLNYEIDD